MLMTEAASTGAHWTTREWIHTYRAHLLATRGGKGKKRGPRLAKGVVGALGIGERDEHTSEA